MKIRILAAVLCITAIAYTGCVFRDADDKPVTEPANTPGATETSGAADPSLTSDAAATKTTPASSTATTDPEPSATADPDPTNEIPTYTGDVEAAESGVLSSDTGTPLNLEARWSSKAEGDKVTVTVELHLCYSSIFVGARSGCPFTVNGEKTEFSSPQISKDDMPRESMLLATKTVTANADENGIAVIPVYASWYFYGTYAGVKIDALIIDGNIIAK